MVWKYLSQTGKPRNFKFVDNKVWWLTSLDEIHIQITAGTLRQAFPYIKRAYEQKKPYIFHIHNNLRGTLSQIDNLGKRPNELLIQSYGAELRNVNFDPTKINNLTENAVHLYYDWEDVPTRLKQFIMNKSYQATLW